MKAYESILDIPRPGLCEDVWRMDESGAYVLTPEAETKIDAFVRYIKRKFGMPGSVHVRLVGSLMSNSYSDSSDIDVHFSSDLVRKSRLDDLNQLIWEAVQEYKAEYPDMLDVAGHPLEAYFLDNTNHDLTSVGCYDFDLRKWLVGPEMKDLSFDPYKKYFGKDMKRLSGIIGKVRQSIFETYELALVMLKSNDPEFKERHAGKMLAAFRRAKSIYEQLRGSRSFKGRPSSPSAAAKIRKSSDWAVSDSSFKLMGKFGYIGQLREISHRLEDVDSGKMDCETAARAVIQAFSENISSKNINDSELVLCESLRGMMSFTALAAVLAIPGLTSTQALAGQLRAAYAECASSGTPFNSASKRVKDAITASQTKSKTFGGLSMSNAVNAVSMVLWHESRGEGEKGQKAVLSVILNRCGGDFNFISAVLKQKSQFSCIKKLYRGGWTDRTYRYFTPSAIQLKNPENERIWKYIQSLAVDMLNGKFESTIGRRNAYLNMETADKDAVNTWGQKMEYRVGHHMFGYLPEYDAKIMVPGTMTTRRRAAQRTVTVKSGDNLGKIAQKNNTTVERILKLNPDIKDPNRIKIGQILKI